MNAPAISPVPPGMHTITPHLVCRGAAEAIDFYARAFGAVELFRLDGPDGLLMHASVRIGDSVLMLVDERPQMGAKGPLTLGGSAVTIHLSVTDAAATARRAEAAGARVRMPVAEMFWGAQYGVLEDPYGHLWSVATQVRHVAPEDMPAALRAQMGGHAPAKD